MTTEPMLIPLTQGKFAIVDPEDYEELSQHKWYCHHGYAVRNVFNPNSKSGQSSLSMHTVILRPPEGFETDHISGDKLDNRRSNLRWATHRDNSRNRRIHKNNSLGIKGVTFQKEARGKKYRSEIKVNRKNIFLGHFATPEQASEAYVNAAKEYFGEFAAIC